MGLGLGAQCYVLGLVGWVVNVICYVLGLVGWVVNVICYIVTLLCGRVSRFVPQR
jgi:hypothetical protein